jgi:DNA-binding CsgD family transcriptional regulator
MVAEGRLDAGTRVLHVTRVPVERLELLQDVITASALPDRRLAAIVDPENVALVERAIRLADLPTDRVSVVGTDAVLARRSAQTPLPAAFEATVGEVLGSQDNVFLYVELDAIIAACGSPDEMLQTLRALDPSRFAVPCSVSETVSAAALREPLPADFYSLHDEWLVSGSFASPARDGRLLDQKSIGSALASPETRRRFVVDLAAEASGPDLPRPFASGRSGLLVLDADLTIRHATPRAAALLGRDPGEVDGQPISSCVDGVDLLAIRNECARAPAGSPFIVSWRKGPGMYESLEVVVDPLLPGSGFLLTLRPVEKVRSAQAVYRDMKNEVSGGSPSNDTEPAIRDQVTETLSGTKITRREHEILLLILAGRTIRELSRELDIEEVTVKKHLTNIYRKLRVSGRTELRRSFGVSGPDGEDE